MGINGKAFTRNADLTKSEDSAPSHGQERTVKGRKERYNKSTKKWKKVKNSEGKIVDRSKNTAYG